MVAQYVEKPLAFYTLRSSPIVHISDISQYIEIVAVSPMATDLLIDISRDDPSLNSSPPLSSP